MWYLYTMEYYSAIKRHKTVPFVEMRMNLKFVIQSDIKSERVKQVSYTNACMWNLEKRYR